MRVMYFFFIFVLTMFGGLTAITSDLFVEAPKFNLLLGPLPFIINEHCSSFPWHNVSIGTKLASQQCSISIYTVVN